MCKNTFKLKKCSWSKYLCGKTSRNLVENTKNYPNQFQPSAFHVLSCCTHNVISTHWAIVKKFYRRYVYWWFLLDIWCSYHFLMINDEFGWLQIVVKCVFVVNQTKILVSCQIIYSRWIVFLHIFGWQKSFWNEVPC